MPTTEVKDILKDGEKDKDGKVITPAPETKAEPEVKPDLGKSEKEKALETKVSDLEFNDSFKEVATTYPHATGFKDKIREKVKAGYSVEDATIAVLAKEKKLQTAQEIKAEELRGEGFGGSSSTIVKDQNGKPVGEKTAAEYAQEFKDAEARGEILLS